MNDTTTTQTERRAYHGNFPLTTALCWAIFWTSFPIIVAFTLGTGIIDKWYAWLAIAFNGWFQGTLMAVNMTKAVMREKGYKVDITLKS